MKIQNVKGCYDFLPNEQKVRNYINDILKETFESYGYLSIETPILSYYDMLSDKYDEENDILKEIYKLKDQGDRNLGLRYDLTVPFAKFIALNKNNLKLPFKRYEIAKVFRDGPVKVGRDREFTQCDIDVVGLSGQEIEAELISLYLRAFNKMNIEVIIKYNSRNLMRGIVEELVDNKDIISNVITIIDKIDKITKDEFISCLKEYGIKEEVSNKLLEYFKLDLKAITKVFKNTNNELIKKGLEELNNLNNLLKDLKINKNCIFTPSLARGQEYYTGNVFEVYEKNGLLTSSIGGGGRYDNMITEFKDEFIKSNEIDIYVIPLNTFKDSFIISEKLRSIGLNVLLELENKKLKKCLDYANKEEIDYVLIIGEDELKEEKLQLKNMKDGTISKISLKNINKVKDIIKKKNK